MTDGTLAWRELREEVIGRLVAAEVDDPVQEYRWMAEQACGSASPPLDEPMTQREVKHMDDMVGRRVAGEPLQYVLGHWAFRTLDLLVDQRVLIPRPETEVVAGLAIDAAASIADRSPVVVDLGTGSGAIALSAAAELWPDVEVWATDASVDALAVARANMAGLGRRATVVRLCEGSWYSALPEDLRGRVDVLVSNPPYVATTDDLPADVADWEPTEALLAGDDGLDDIRVIVAGAHEWLSPRGALVVEIGETQGDEVVALARAAGFVAISVEPDLAGRPRALLCRRP